MRVRMPKNALPISIAALAVAIALSGTAYAAVAATKVNIADAVTPTRIAHVDANGHLLTTSNIAGIVTDRPTPPAQTLNSALDVTTGLNILAGPTTATLAFDRLAAENPAQNASLTNTNFVIRIVRTAATSATQCSPNIGSSISADRLPVGANLVDAYNTPLVFKPAGGQPYCVGAYLQGEIDAPTSYYIPFVQLTGYVVSGTYTGRGSTYGTSSPTAARAAPGPAVLATPADPVPAGSAPHPK